MLSFIPFVNSVKAVEVRYDTNGNLKTYMIELESLLSLSLSNSTLNFSV